MTSRLKVKNPCNICLQGVTNKTGIQCRGACRKWAHFTCLNYSPGKVKDIKSGAISITCPCPDCINEKTKEDLTKPLNPCTNQKFPGGKDPTCDEQSCPSKIAKPIPSAPRSTLVSPPSTPETTPPSSSSKCSPRIKQTQKAREPPCGPKPPCAQPKSAKVSKSPQESKPAKAGKPPQVSSTKSPPCLVLRPCPSKEKKQPVRPQPCPCVEKHSLHCELFASSDV